MSNQIKSFMTISLIIYFQPSGFSKINTNQFLFEDDSCGNFNITKILTNYFYDKECLTIISLSTNYTLSNNYYDWFGRPQVLKSVTNDYFKTVENNVSIRRRRRDFLTHEEDEHVCQGRLEGFFILTPNLDLLNKFVFSDNINPFWIPSSKFFMYVGNSISKSTNITTLIDRILVEYHAIHVTVGCCTCQHVCSLLRSREGPGLKPTCVDITDVSNNADLIEFQTTDLNGYTIRTTMFPSVMAKPIYKNKKIIDYEGIDPNLLNLLAEKLNFTTIIVSANNESFGRLLSNGTLTGALGTLVTGKSDLAAVGYFTKEYGTKDVEPLGSAMGDDDLCVVVHRSRIVPAWFAPVKYIGIDVCAFLGAVYFGLGITWIIIQRVSPDKDKKIDINLIFLNTWRLMLTSSIPHGCSRTSERLFLAFCMAAFVTLAGTFQGTLVTVYSTLFYFPDINTLEQLADTGIPILTRFEAFKNDVFTNESSSGRSRLQDMVKIYSEKEEINVLIATHGTVAGLTRISSMDMDNKTSIFDNRGNNLLHVVKECVRTYGLCFMVPKSSAFADIMNQIILQASQFGLLNKWYSDMKFNNTKLAHAKKKHRNQGNTEDNRPLGLQDLQLAAYELILGLVLSCLVFVIEILKLFILEICKNYCRSEKIINE